MQFEVALKHAWCHLPQARDQYVKLCHPHPMRQVPHHDMALMRLGACPEFDAMAKCVMCLVPTLLACLTEITTTLQWALSLAHSYYVGCFLQDLVLLYIRSQASSQLRVLCCMRVRVM